MWIPTYKGDFKKLKDKKVKVTHKLNNREIESEGLLLDFVWDVDFIKESYLVMKIKNSYNKHNKDIKCRIYIGRYLNAIPSKDILQVEIECDEIEDLIKSKKSISLDVANTILEFSGKYITL